MPQEKSKFELLREKSILSILDGDVDFGTLEVNGTDSGIKISMPYLSGPTLCDISNKFGLPVTYGWNGGAQSRWAYLDDLLAHCIQNKRESDLLAFLFSKICNLMSLEDKTARGLGVNVNLMRILISLIAVLLASISTAVAGAISFLGLIVPHIGRILVGSDHRALVPFSMLAGAFTFLLADTIGRTVAAPYEVSASIIMSVIGGPFFIILLRRSKKYAA